MKTKWPLVIIGAGGHGREAMDVALDCGKFEVVGFVSEDRPSADMLFKYKTKWLGTVDYLLDKSYYYVIAIGDCADKKKVSDKLVNTKCCLINVLHPSAYVGRYCSMGGGVMMYAGAKITTNVSLGDHVHLNVNAVASHDCSIGDYSIISPGAMLNGNVTIGKGVFVGTGAIILPKVTVGDWATIGAGAVVTKDVPSCETYVGVPARRLAI
jgi:sugar O-acyltransferase (sialic acid O-acetyltransferase NeuD family)